MPYSTNVAAAPAPVTLVPFGNGTAELETSLAQALTGLPVVALPCLDCGGLIDLAKGNCPDCGRNFPELARVLAV